MHVKEQLARFYMNSISHHYLQWLPRTNNLNCMQIDKIELGADRPDEEQNCGASRPAYFSHQLARNRVDGVRGHTAAQVKEVLGEELCFFLPFYVKQREGN